MARSGANRRATAAKGNAVPQKAGKNNGNGKGGGGGGGAGKGGKGARSGKGGMPAGQWTFVPASAPSKKTAQTAPRPKAAPRPQVQQMASRMMPWMTGAAGGKGSQGKGKVMNWMNAQKAVMAALQQQRRPQRAAVANTNNKAKAKANANGKGKGKGAGNGNGTNKKEKAKNVELEKLQPLDASLKVWVSGLDEKTSWKKVKEHFHANKVALMPQGKACVAFDSASEAEGAIATLNGSDFGGNTLEVDVWTQREKREPGSKKNDKKTLGKTGFAAKVAKKAAQKVKKDQKKKMKAGKQKKNNKFWEQLKELDHTLKVKVSNLPEGAGVKKLMAHFKDLGAECQLLDIMTKERKGKITKINAACVGFESADQAESAVAMVGGTDFQGNTLEVAAWGEKKPRVNYSDQ